jgi:hypothetical protein
MAWRAYGMESGAATHGPRAGKVGRPCFATYYELSGFLGKLLATTPGLGMLVAIRKKNTGIDDFLLDFSHFPRKSINVRLRIR